MPILFSVLLPPQKYTTLLTLAIGGDFVAIKHPRRCALQQTWLITLSKSFHPSSSTCSTSGIFRVAHRVHLTWIDGSVTQALSLYRLGLSQLSWCTVDRQKKAVCFCQMTGVNGVDGRHGRVHGFWHEISCTKAVITFQPPHTPWMMGHLALNISSFINHS